jgi:hypothetical protein
MDFSDSDEEGESDDSYDSRRGKKKKKSGSKKEKKSKKDKKKVRVYSSAINVGMRHTFWFGVMSCNSVCLVLFSEIKIKEEETFS